jgi:Tol biopolymer transport system component
MFHRLRLPVALAAIALACSACNPIAVLLSLSSTQAQGNGDSYTPAPSDGGRYVAFVSNASNLVAGDTNNASDIFVRDTVANTTTIASVSSGGVLANGGSNNPFITADGSRVAFTSSATNLAANDTNGATDVFVRDRTTNKTILVSSDSLGHPANGGSTVEGMSAEGRFVLFDSTATNIAGAPNTSEALYRADLLSGTITTVALVPSCGQDLTPQIRGALSPNGQNVAYVSTCDPQQPDVFGTIDVVTGPVGGTMTTIDTYDAVGVGALYDISTPSLSSDGSVVAWGEWSVGLHGFIGEGAAARVWTGSEPPAAYDAGDGSGAREAAVSPDGHYIAWTSAGTPTGCCPNGFTGPRRVYVMNFVSKKVKQATVTTDGLAPNGSSFNPRFSTNGSHIAFSGPASNLVNNDTNGFQDVFYVPISALFGPTPTAAPSLISQ